MVALTETRYRYDATLSRTGVGQGFAAAGRLTAHAVTVLALGYGETSPPTRFVAPPGHYESIT